MRLSSDSYRKLKNWTNQINEETGNPKNYVFGYTFAKAYIKNSYDFVVKNFSYDSDAKPYLSKFSGEVYVQKFLERENLERFIQERVGVCKQFASLLYILTANEFSNLHILNGVVTPEIIVNCTIKMKNGRPDSHSCNSYIFAGDRYFCDPTMQRSFNKQDFFLKSEKDIQKQYYEAEKSRLEGRADVCEIKTKPLDKFCDLISDFKFYRNKETEDYKTSTINFGPGE